jgi:hypothetical protein
MTHDNVTAAFDAFREVEWASITDYISTCIIV